MGRLMKTELFRMSNSGKNMVSFAIVLILLCFYPFSGQWEYLDAPLAISLVYFWKNVYVFLLIAGFFVAILLASQYQSRLYYYEVMNGENTHKIILSKLVIYIGYIVLFFIIPNLILYITLAVRNGLGGYENIIMSVGLFGVTTFRMITRAVLLTMIIRRLIPVLGILYISFMLEQAIILIIEGIFDTSHKLWKVIFNFFISQQVNNFYQPMEYAGEFVVTVIVSFIMEAVLLYGLTWYSYKKKNFR